MTTITVYGQWAVYDESTKRVETRLDKFDVELMPDESWKAPTGFNVSVVKVNV